MSSTSLEEAVQKLVEATDVIRALTKDNEEAQEARKKLEEKTRKAEEERKTQQAKWERNYTALQTKLDKVCGFEILPHWLHQICACFRW